MEQVTVAKYCDGASRPSPAGWMSQGSLPLALSFALYHNQLIPGSFSGSKLVARVWWHRGEARGARQLGHAVYRNVLATRDALRAGSAGAPESDRPNGLRCAGLARRGASFRALRLGRREAPYSSSAHRN